MKRRDFIAVLGAAAALPTAGWAQQPDKQIPRVGFLSPSTALATHDAALRQGLRELGYFDGKNIAIEARFAEGKFDQLPDLAAELVALKVDVIVAAVTQSSLAAKAATRTIPIVMQGVSDPVGTGLVASLARPGGNITGTSGMSAEVVGKSLELLKEAIPTLSRLAVLWNPANAVFQAQLLRQAEAVGAVLGIELQTFAVASAGQFDQVFSAIAAARTGAMLVLADPILTLHKARIINFAERSRLPTMYGTKDYVAAGGFISYGPDYGDVYRRAATYVVKIIKGAKPADLPVEQSTKFPLVLNLKTAKTLGLTVPPTLLARADEVIE